MGNFTLTQVHFLLKKLYFYFVIVGDAPLVTLSKNASIYSKRAV